MPETFASPDDFKAAVGKSLGTSEWLTIDQQRVNLFADATDDHQWIHVDVERATAGPFGVPIAHGYLTLSLVNHFMLDLLAVPAAKMGINYGCNKVRFPAPVPVGSKVRASGEIIEVGDIAGGVQVIVRVSIETDAGGKPACVADTVSRFIF